MRRDSDGGVEVAAGTPAAAAPRGMGSAAGFCAVYGSGSQLYGPAGHPL